MRRQAADRHRESQRAAQRAGHRRGVAAQRGHHFGAEDYGREIGLPTVREGEARDLIYARSAIVVAAASAHVQAVDGVWVDLNDSAGLLGFAKQARQLGFTGMSCIHPSQVEAINTVFSPTAEEIDYCKKVLQAFEEANARGDGSIAFGGHLAAVALRRWAGVEARCEPAPAALRRAA